MAQYRTHPPLEMNNSKVVKIVDVKNSTITYPESGKVMPLALDKSNVMQFYLEDGSKISARPSGTEPKIKYYFSVQAPLPSVGEYRKVEQQLNEKLAALKTYFS